MLKYCSIISGSNSLFSNIPITKAYNTRYQNNLINYQCFYGNRNFCKQRPEILDTHIAPKKPAILCDDIFKACEIGDFNSVAYLIHHSPELVNKNKNHNYPIHFAALYGHKYIIELLHKKGANISIGNAKIYYSFTVQHQYILLQLTVTLIS